MTKTESYNYWADHEHQPLRAVSMWTPDKVASSEDPHRAFAEYMQQNLGTPWATNKDMLVFRRHVKELFAKTPQADWFTLCRVVGWCKSRRKRPARLQNIVLIHFREAFADGALPELEPNAADDNVELKIEKALAEEKRPEWRRRLLGATGREARAEAFEAWQSNVNFV